MRGGGLRGAATDILLEEKLQCVPSEFRPETERRTKAMSGVQALDKQQKGEQVWSITAEGVHSGGGVGEIWAKWSLKVMA